MWKIQIENIFSSGADVEVIFDNRDEPFNATIQGRDGANLLIACDSDAAPLLRCGKRVKIRHAADGHCFEIDSIVSVYRENYFVVPMTSPQKIQRRHTTRILCRLKAIYAPRFYIAANKLDVSKPHPCCILNISFGGVLLALPDMIITGSQILIETNLEEEIPIKLTAVVTRCEIADAAEPLLTPRMPHRAGCRFLLMSRTDQIRLRRYVASYLPIGLSS